MKFIDWNKIKLVFSKKQNPLNQKDYLLKLIDAFETLEKSGDNLSFVVADIKDKGFVIKVGGLFGFVSFNHMPWKYSNFDAWRAVFPTLTGKVFFCRVHYFNKHPLSIVINGEIPQFRKIELVENEIYKGVIIGKTNYGLFIDIGYGFKWKCGSMVGLLHKFNFETIESYNETKTGDIVESTFWRYNEKGQPILGNRDVLGEWFAGEIDRLVGEILPVEIIVLSNGEMGYLVNKKYNATLPTTKLIYGKNRAQVKKAVKVLKSGDIIHCEVIKINHNTRKLQLKWNFLHEIEGVIANGNPALIELDKNNPEAKKQE